MPLTYVFPKGTVAESEPVPDLAWTAPASVAVATGTTSTNVTWASASGGVSPYTYGATTLKYDSAGNYTQTVSDASLVTTISGMANGSTYVLERIVTDSEGTQVTIQAAVVVGAASATITAGTAPSSQTLAAGTLSATIGTWGAPSGGTGPYTYSLTEPTGNGAVISGSGLGPYTVTGLTNGRTYAFQLEITDSLSAKGYSVVTISIAYAVPEWEVLLDVDFTDANWTALNSTDATASTAAAQHTLYAADGTTPRARVWNNTAQARRLRIDPSGTGLALIGTSTTASPSIKVELLNSAGVNIFSTLNWTDDLIKVEFLAEGEEPAGSGGFAHLVAFSSAFTNGANQHGYRTVESTSKVRPIRRSWTTSDDSINQAILDVGSTRKYQVQWEGYITGSRTIESYGREGTSLTALTPIPRSGKYYFHQCVSQTHTASPTLTAFGATTSSFWGIMMYHDGTAIDSGSAGGLSRNTLKKVRISRLPSGSKA